MNIAVAGTGYVGLSLAVLLSQDNDVIAVDILPEKVEMLKKWKSPILHVRMGIFSNRCIVDVIIIAISTLLTWKIPLRDLNYTSWLFQAVEVSAVWFVVSLVVNAIFCRDELYYFAKKIIRR